MTLWCLVKALGMSTWEVLRRIPRVIWFVVVLGILPILMSLLVSVILWLLFVVVLSRTGNTLIILFGLFGGLAIMLCLYVVLSHTIISGQDFNRWLKHMDLPCDEESFSRYMNFKKEHRLGMMGDAMPFKFATCRHEIYTEKEDVQC